MRIGNQTKRHHERFDCQRLGGVALVQIVRDWCIHENPSESHCDSKMWADCANKFDCGLFVRDKYGNERATEDVNNGCCCALAIMRAEYP